VASHRPSRFGPVEVALIGLLGVALGVVAAAMAVPRLLSERYLVPEADPFRAAYGPGRHSHHVEEWLIRDFFQDRRNGFFLDVGANHYRTHSNTYFLEVELGWEGIAIEPLVEFEADYTRFRPRTRFKPFFVSDVSDQQARLYSLPSAPLVSSGVEQFTKEADKEFRTGEAVQSREVPTITLDDLLAAEGVERIDFLSMDIELWEPKALAGFDIRRFLPALVCIEANAEVRQQIIDYFTQHDYVVLGRYLRADIWNLYFAPMGTR
jgi:FkbM family methyltransferase